MLINVKEEEEEEGVGEKEEREGKGGAKGTRLCRRV